MNSHLMGVFPATVSVIALLALSWRTPALHPTLRLLARLASGLVLAQIVLGVATFRLHLQVEVLTVSHHSVGAALLATLVIFTVLGLRDRQVALNNK